MQQILSNLKQLVFQALISAKLWTFLIGLTATWMAKENIVLPPDIAQEIALGFAALLAGQIVTAHVVTTQQAKAALAMQASMQEHRQDVEKLQLATGPASPLEPDLKKAQGGFIHAPLLALFAFVGLLVMVGASLLSVSTMTGCASTSALGTCEVSVLEKQLPNSSGTIVTDIIDAIASGGSALPALLATVDSIYPGSLACLGSFVDDLISKYLVAQPAGSGAGSAVVKLGVLDVDHAKTLQGLAVYHSELRKRHIKVNTSAAP